MINAIAAPAREMDPQHPPMACSLAPGAARAQRWPNGRREGRGASSTPDRGLACPALVATQTVETPSPRAPFALAFRHDIGADNATIFVPASRPCSGSPRVFWRLAAPSPGEWRKGIGSFLQPRDMLMVILWCREARGPDSAWPMCGRVERRPCGLSRSRGLLGLLTTRDPCGDDAIGVNRPVFCRRHPGADDSAGIPHHLRRAGPRAARADGWHRGGRQRCKLDVRRLDSIDRGGGAQTNGSDGAMARAPSRCEMTSWRRSE
jgi:hypothetical protein